MKFTELLLDLNQPIQYSAVLAKKSTKTKVNSIDFILLTVKSIELFRKLSKLNQ